MNNLSLAETGLVKNLGQRIRARRESLRMTQEELANCIGVSYQSVQAWEGGTVPRPKKFEKIAACLKTSVEELFYGKLPESPKSVESPTVGLTLVDLKSRVPLISWAQAGAWAEIQDTFHPGDAERWIAVTAKVGQMAFALRVVGDSMEPRIPDGSIVVIDPDRPAIHGSIVLAKRTSDQTATLKVLWHDGETPYLKPINSAYPILPCPTDTRIVGVAVQVVLDL